MAVRKLTLEDLWDEMQRGRIYECSLRDSSDKFQVDGLLSGASIYVDPRPAIIETLLHELMHRLKPKLCERTVTVTARNLAVQMDEATKLRWWKGYNRIKKKGRPVECGEDD